ncbi:MAG TPA: tyrosine-type recombinase/integrase, partial [Prosthecobacter sp.]|nr:tyrosine-type recombinase/integrase [Prosthecobacter sp.]
MPRRGTRTRLAPGIYQDASGYEVQVNRGRGTGNSKRFAATEDRDADLRRMRRWQLRRQIELLQSPARPTQTRTGLAVDVPAYLATLTGRKKRDAETLMDHWLQTALAQLPRHEITPLMIRTQMAAWLEAGVAASTINHRVYALRALYRVLDDSDLNAPNPTLKIQKLPEPRPEPREIPRGFRQAIFAAMPDRGRPTRGADRPTVSLTKLRQMVKATTGLPDAQIMRLRMEHVNWRGRAVWVTPRRKGKGATGRWLPLTPSAVQALKAFFAGGASGHYSTSAAAKSWHRAVKAVTTQWAQDGIPLPPLPPNLRPYDLRHTFLTEAYRRSGNIRAVQELAL